MAECGRPQFARKWPQRGAGGEIVTPEWNETGRTRTRNLTTKDYGEWLLKYGTKPYLDQIPEFKGQIPEFNQWAAWYLQKGQYITFVNIGAAPRFPNWFSR